MPSDTTACIGVTWNAYENYITDDISWSKISTKKVKENLGLNPSTWNKLQHSNHSATGAMSTSSIWQIYWVPSGLSRTAESTDTLLATFLQASEGWQYHCMEMMNRPSICSVPKSTQYICWVEEVDDTLVAEWLWCLALYFECLGSNFALCANFTPVHVISHIVLICMPDHSNTSSGVTCVLCENYSSHLTPLWV